MKSRLFFVILVIVLALNSAAQPIDQRFMHRLWDAQWITHPSAGLKGYEIFHFRKQFVLSEKPAHFIVHLSADSRYKFFVNGKMVGLGPARSDLAHWYFDSYDLAPYLQKGNNTLAALVWNQGEWNGLSQHSYRTAFILQGNGVPESVANTDEQWRVMKDEAYHPVVFQPVDPRLFWQYYVAGALDSVQADHYPWNWETADYDDHAWSLSKLLGKGTPDGIENHTMWNLMPRPVAFLETSNHSFEALRASSGISVSNRFPAPGDSIVIPPNSKVSFLLDTRLEVTGYPRLTVSKGSGSSVKIGYAETLLDMDKEHPGKWHKTNRNEVKGKKFIGVYDCFLPDGGNARTFIPLWMRVFRYVQIEVETKEQPLVINSVNYDFTLYPFQNEASFSSNDSVHRKIFDACLRTVRLASQETYIDPYYEQMQYIGDTRIEALYAYYHFRDDRLTRNAILQFDWSRSPAGITMSRYPSDLPQYTPLYSLCWMLMIHDYWMLRDDEPFVKQFIPGMLGVLEWFRNKINREGMLGDLPYLDFLDSKYDRDKILNASESKSLTPYALFYVYTVQQLKPLFGHFGQAAAIAPYEKAANEIKQNVIRKCFDPSKGLFSDNTDKKIFSQHANIMAMLTHCLPRGEEKKLMHKVLTDSSLLPISLYFKFYEFQALQQAGLGSEILDQMGDWKTMLHNGMHTFSEWLEDPRSDCHSWSAYPAYYFLNSIAGIRPASPGFKTVLIEPETGKLKNIKASMLHPSGMINVSYEKQTDGRWKVEVQLPAHLSGSLTWKGKTYPLPEGKKQEFLLR